MTSKKVPATLVNIGGTSVVLKSELHPDSVLKITYHKNNIKFCESMITNHFPGLPSVKRITESEAKIIDFSEAMELLASGLDNWDLEEMIQNIRDDITANWGSVNLASKNYKIYLIKEYQPIAGASELAVSLQKIIDKIEFDIDFWSDLDNLPQFGRLLIHHIPSEYLYPGSIKKLIELGRKLFKKGEACIDLLQAASNPNVMIDANNKIIFSDPFI